MPTASSSHATSCPLSMAPWRMMALHALEVQICVLTCSCALSACFPLVSGDRAHRKCSGITDMPVTLPNWIMETYWFFFHCLRLSFPLTEVAGAFRVTGRKLRQSSVVMLYRSLLPDTWREERLTSGKENMGWKKSQSAHQSVPSFLGLIFYQKHSSKRLNRNS